MESRNRQAVRAKTAQKCLAVMDSGENCYIAIVTTVSSCFGSDKSSITETQACTEVKLSPSRSMNIA